MTVTDFMSGRQMDIQALMDLEKVNRGIPESKFNFSVWTEDTENESGDSCGTVGCLGGNYLVWANRADFFIAGNSPVFIDDGKRRYEMPAMQLAFGISILEAMWLFDPYFKGRTGPQNRDICVRRVRKFIYYKLRKSELLADYDKSRRLGDVGILKEVLEYMS